MPRSQYNNTQRHHRLRITLSSGLVGVQLPPVDVQIHFVIGHDVGEGLGDTAIETMGSTAAVDGLALMSTAWVLAIRRHLRPDADEFVVVYQNSWRGGWAGH